MFDPAPVWGVGWDCGGETVAASGWGVEGSAAVAGRGDEGCSVEGSAAVTSIETDEGSVVWN